MADRMQGDSKASGFQPGRWTYAGLFFVALATLMYEILLTRIFSVTTSYHFAFAAISVAMFGMTAGAVLVYQLPRRFTPDKANRQMAVSALLFSIASVAAFITHTLLPYLSGGEWEGFGALAPTYVVVAVPFVFSGVSVCIALTKCTGGIGRMYASDLLGAATGCVALILALKLTDGPTAVIAVGFLGAVGAALFARDRCTPFLGRVAVGVAIVLGLAAALHTLLVWNQTPVVRLHWVKGKQEQHVIYEKWNSFSRVTVTGDPIQVRRPRGWGMSPRLRPTRGVRELDAYIDSTAGTMLTGFTGKQEEIDHLRYDIVNLAHYLRPGADVLIIGSGGGRDVLAALAFYQTSVVGVEINEEIIRAITGPFGDYTGHLDRIPQVTLVNDDARAFLARQERTFDIIQVSFIDTWAATAAGALVLAENSLYTVEAWKIFLDRLKPGGILTVSRWYSRDRPSEIYRLTSLAATALLQRGATDPRQHIAIARRMRHTAEGIGTLLLCRDPFTNPDLDALNAAVGNLGFELILTPHFSRDDFLSKLAGAATLQQAVNSYPLKIDAPTDDSPFFFHMLRFRDVFNTRLHRQWERGAGKAQVKAVSVLGTLLAVTVAMNLLFVVGPLALTSDRSTLKGSLPFFVYFAGIGTGFMLVEISQMQRLVIVLGHATYALSVVLFSLLVSSGLGSLLSDRIGASELAKRARFALAALVAALVLFGLLMPHAAAALEGAPTPVRILAAGGILFGLGLLMGMPFPLGMRLAASRAAGLTPWLWGVNGATSVCASVLAMAIALSAGISAAFWAGLGCYLLSGGAFVWASWRR